VVKRAASDCLAKHGIRKADVDFKEIWGFIYRGTEFALVRPTLYLWIILCYEPESLLPEEPDAVTCHR